MEYLKSDVRAGAVWVWVPPRYDGEEDRSPPGTIWDHPDGESGRVALPGRREVCPDCRGTGRQWMAELSGGITADEWGQWDAEERESLLCGDYDVPCRGCGGERVIVDVDDDRARRECPDAYRWYAELIDQIAEHAACDAAERRMGA